MKKLTVGRLLAASLLLLGLAGPASADELRNSYERGMQLYRQQRFTESVPQFEKVVRLSEQLYGKDSPKVSVDLNNLGEAYRRAGRLPEAARTLERAIRLDREIGGETPALATSLNNLALVYRGQGRFDDAMPLHERALLILRNSLGPKSPDLAKVLNNQAITSLAGGQSVQAVASASEALAIAKASLGANDPTTRTIQQTLDRAKATKPSAPAIAEPAAVPPVAAIAQAPGKGLPPPPSALAPRTAPPVPPVALDPPAPASPPRPAKVAVVAPPAVAAPARPVRPAAPATVAPQRADGRFTLHLGSVRSAAEADAEWRRLRGKYPSLAPLQKLAPETVEIQGKGKFFRVLAGYLPTRDAAASLCDPIRASGTNCDVRQR